MTRVVDADLVVVISFLPISQNAIADAARGGRLPD